MEAEGALFVGDILFTIPPVSMRFSETNQSSSIPTMRTDGSPILTHNNSIPRVDITLFFNGEHAINTQLRPLVSMFQRMPFSTIQNHTVHAAWIGRREIEDKQNPYAKDASNRFHPIPCYLENISLSTLPGFPNTVQAHISIVRMNRAPYGITGRMWKSWEDAEAAAYERTIRTARDCTLYSTDRDENLKKDTLYIMDSTQQSHKVEIWDDVGSNPKLNPLKSTKFPQESLPFKYQYRHILIDDGLSDPAQYGLQNYTLGTDLFGNQKDLSTHWPSYKAEDNDRIYLTYKSAKQFSDPIRRFVERINDLQKNNQKIQSMANQITTMSDAQLMNFFQPVQEISFTKLAWKLVDTVSVVKEFKDFQNSINQAFGKLVNAIIIDDAGDPLPMFGPATDFGVCKDEANDLFMMMYGTQGVCENAGFSWIQDKFFTFRSVTNPDEILPIPKLGSSMNDFVYVDSSGQIIDTFEEFGKFMDAILGNTGSCSDVTAVTKEQCEKAGADWKLKPETEQERLDYLARVNAIVEPLIANYIDDPLESLGLKDIGSKWNYNDVAVELSWIEDGEDDILSGNGSKINALAMYSKDNQYLVDENKHRERIINVNSASPYHYQFQSVVQSITYNYGNAVTPHFISSSNIPVYQHLGVTNPTATMVFRTRDERLLKILTDMRESLQEVGMHMLGGKYELAGLGTVDITGNLLGHSSDRVVDKNLLGSKHSMGIAASGELSGFLLNSIGFAQSSIENLTMRSIDGEPGWWEVTMDFIGNNQNIKILEMLDEVGVTQLPSDMFAYMEHFFPCHLSDFSYLMDYIKKWGTNASTIENYESVLETVSGTLETVKNDGKQLHDLYIQRYDKTGASISAKEVDKKEFMHYLKQRINWTRAKVEKLIVDSATPILDHLQIKGGNTVYALIDSGGELDFTISGAPVIDVGDNVSGCYIHDKVKLWDRVEFPGFMRQNNVEDLRKKGVNLTAADLRKGFIDPVTKSYIIVWDENNCKDGQAVYYAGYNAYGQIPSGGFFKDDAFCDDNYPGSGRGTEYGCNEGAKPWDKLFHAEWITGNDELSQDSLYKKILGPVMAQMNVNLERLRSFDDERAKDPQWAELHPMEWRLAGAMESYYKDYIKNVIYMISNIAKGASRNILLRPSNQVLFPGYSTDSTALQQTNISDQTIIAQSLVLANQIRTVFYYLLRREDFRDFIDSQLVIRNQAILHLVEKLEGDITNIEGNYGGVEAAIVGYTNKDEWVLAIGELINQIKSKTTYLDNGSAGVTDTYKEFISKLNATVGKNHPDLKLPNFLMNSTGHRYVSPGFPFVDDDHDLELIEMSKLSDQLKMSTFAQLAAITSGDFELYYNEFENMIDEAGEDADVTLSKIIENSFQGSDKRDVQMTKAQMPAGLKELVCSVGTPGQYTTEAECTGAGGTVTWKFTFKHLLNNFKRMSELKERIETAQKEGNAADLENQEFLVPSKERIMTLMSTTAMLDYSLSVIFASKWLSQVKDAVTDGATNTQLMQNMTDIANKIQDSLKEYNFDTANFGAIYQDVVLSQYSHHIKVSSADTQNKISEIGMALAEEIGKKRKAAASIATIAASNNWPAFLNYFGIGDVNSVKKSYELKNQFHAQVQNKLKSSMDRAFPAFKIFFIEEDKYSWQAFDDFYTYDAASEITIVESKHAASTTAIIKLSNVTNALTQEQVTFVNETSALVPGALMRLKVGTKIMILMGYGADYRQLRLKFKGAVTEMKTGTTIELTAQSWGAGLLNTVGATQGTKYSAMSGATTLGAAVLDILAQTPGLGGLGRWEMRDADLNSQAKVSESALKNIYYARALNSMAGYLTDVIPIDTNIRDVIGGFNGQGLPTTGVEVAEAYRTNNIIVKAMGNSLYDNIIVNDTMPSGYGFYNFIDRGINRLKQLSGTQGKPFQWVVTRQTCWDALHEVALFMGDYIITTLPFNEGNDIFQHAPRETLYFGPREGQYRAKTYVPRIAEKNVMENLATQIKKMLTFNYCDKIDEYTGAPYETIGACEANGGKWITEMDYTGLSDREIEEHKDKATNLKQQVIRLGKQMMSKVIDYTYAQHASLTWGHSNQGMARARTHYLDYDMRRVDRNKSYSRLLWQEAVMQDGQYDGARGDFLEGYRMSLNMNGFKKTAELVGRWDIVYGSYTKNHTTPGTMQAGMIVHGFLQKEQPLIWPYVNEEWKAYRLINPTVWRSKSAPIHDEETDRFYSPPLGVTREILLNDFLHEYDEDGKTAEYNYLPNGYTSDEMKIITDMQNGLIPENLDHYKWMHGNKEMTGIFKYDQPDDKNDGYMDRKYIDQWSNGADQGVFGWIFHQFTATWGPYALGYKEVKGGDSGQSKFPYNSELGGTAWYGDMGAWAKIYRPYFMNIEETIFEDTANYIQNYKSIQESIAAGGMAAHTIAFDIQKALLQGLGFLDAFAYKPVINHHMANSYEDIIDNSIVATSDQMYNHVEMLIPGDEVDPDNNPNKATKRVQAWVSFDQDPDFMRTYQTYQKNVTTDLWYDKDAADTWYDEASAGTNYDGIQKALGLDEAVVSQSILMNAIRPMYQGSLTLLGNPHIKPWDIIHIHDDTLTMYGPVEVEQVVNSISITGGYTTTIIPNLCVYYKQASRAIDNILLDFSNKINTLAFFHNVISHGLTIFLARKTLGSRGFGKDFGASRFFGAPLSLINNWSTKADDAAKMFTKMTAENLIEKKKLARKFLSRKEYKKMVSLAKEATTKTKTIERMTAAIAKSSALASPANVTKNKAISGILTEMDNLLANAGGTLTGKNKKAYEVLTNKLYQQLGGKAGDTVMDPKILAKMQQFTQRYPAFADDLVKMANQLVPGISDDILVRTGVGQVDDLAVRMMKLSDEIAELTRLENIVANGRQPGTRGRPYTNTGANSLKARRERIAKLTTSLMDDLGKKGTVEIIEKTAAKEFTSNWDKLGKTVTSKFTSRAAIGGTVLKLLNVVGWVYTIYEIGDMFWEMYAGQARAKIFLTGMLTCENQLTWVPLEYMGMEYTAGMEGIIGTPRGISTVLMGEMTGDIFNNNRTMVVLDMLAKGARDQIISAGSGQD